MATRLLQQSEATKCGSQLDSSTSGHSWSDHSSSDTATHNHSGRKRQIPGSPSRSFCSPTKKHRSSPHISEHVASPRVMIPPAPETLQQPIVLGKQ